MKRRCKSISDKDSKKRHIVTPLPLVLTRVPCCDVFPGRAEEKYHPPMITISKTVFTIGRLHSCDVTLWNFQNQTNICEKISRKHATIRCSGGVWILENHGTYGTRVGGTIYRPGQRISLRDGDQIIFGADSREEPRAERVEPRFLLL